MVQQRGGCAATRVSPHHCWKLMVLRADTLGFGGRLQGLERFTDLPQEKKGGLFMKLHLAGMEVKSYRNHGGSQE